MAPALAIEEPDVERAESYRSLIREFLDRGEPLVPFVLELPNDDFPALVELLRAYSRGESLPEGFVPHSTFWLVRDDGEVVGASNVRHRLTEREEVLLTCAKTNVASARTILRNGGVLASEEFIPERGEIVQRYAIALGRGAHAKDWK